MHRLRKKRTIEERSDVPKNHTNHHNHPNNLDVWLSRLSHISQFGLFALTIGALYFTVIPLYKTAALEESIARRESELRTMNEKLEVATVALEKVKVEAYGRDRNDLLKKIAFVSPYCSGLMTPPGARNSDKRAGLGDNLLKIDAAQCLRAEFEGSNAKTILTVEDYSYLKDTIENISTKLSKVQKKALLDIELVPERAAKDPSTLAPMGPMAEDVERLDKLIEALVPGFLDNKSTKLQVAIDRTRSKISLDFSDLVSNEIHTILDIDWPKIK